MAASAQTWPSYEVVVGDVEFTVGVDDDATVRFIATTDPAFETPERIRVGDTAAAATAAAPAETIRWERGWGHYVRLPSGWHAFLDDSRTDPSGTAELNLGTRELGRDARITMLFMRN